MSSDDRDQRNRTSSAKPASDSEAALQEELRREAAEGKGSLGDTGENRNLSGSATWETLPDPAVNDG